MGFKVIVKEDGSSYEKNLVLFITTLAILAMVSCGEPEVLESLYRDDDHNEVQSVDYHMVSVVSIENVDDAIVIEESSVYTDEVNSDISENNTKEVASNSVDSSENLPTLVEFGFIDYTEFDQYWFDGIFRCGTDFEAGEYYILPLFGSGALYDVEDSPDDFSWTYQRLLRKVTVQEGQYVNIGNGAIMVPVDEIDTENWPHYGVFLVGKDIRAGEYKIETITDIYATDLYLISGIWGAYQINVNTIEDEPIDSDILPESQTYITLEDGQYIVITNCILTNAEVSEQVYYDEAQSTIVDVPDVASDGEIENEGSLETSSNEAMLSVDGNHFGCTIDVAINILNASFNKYEIDVYSEIITDLHFHKYQLLKNGYDNGNEISFLVDNNGYVTYIEITGPDIYDLMGCVLYEIDKKYRYYRNMEYTG